MSNIILYCLLGLGTGGLVAGIALALVVNYKGTGVINLAMGAVSMLAAYCFWALNTGELGFRLATVPACLVTFLFVVALAVLSEIVAFRPLRTAPPLAKLV